MIIKFQGADRSRFAWEAEQMFRLRANVFSERLGWDVVVKDGLEIDEFDNCNPLYLLSVENGAITGSLRLMPTTGPTLLNGPLSATFDDCVDIRSPLIFECTRFAVDQSIRRRTPAGIAKATAELLMANCELMLEAGILQIMGVIDDRTLPIYRRSGWTPAIVARSKKSPNIIVGLWEVSHVTLDRMIQRNGFSPTYSSQPIVFQKAG